MSTLSRFLIGVIIAGLAFIASLRLYRVYEGYARQEADNPAPTMIFNQVPVSYAPAAPQIPIFRRPPTQAELNNQEIYLQDVPLDPQVAKEQARQTIRSILADYQDDPKLQAFYEEIKQATGQQIDLSVLSGEQLGPLLTQYPQLQEIIARYSKDPQFVSTLQQIFSNPQFVQSVAVLQGEKAN